MDCASHIMVIIYYDMQKANQFYLISYQFCTLKINLKLTQLGFPSKIMPPEFPSY
ncbi:hypothetical protein SAMN04487995_1785 [Dyadobacter koreensis]|uniref:Uncharacterized protein n=1 Tax=Dyadobacter koreensis TaxID=408657 RepID=A0A1H6SR14_9BACT|nr:hypothetical protein SAMN04487995_1785 [Dyadobacter koreensis]